MYRGSRLCEEDVMCDGWVVNAAEFSGGSGSADGVIARYYGHRNSATVKGVGFLGEEDEWVMSGSDDGHIYIWSKQRGNIVWWQQGDEEVVNCLEPHPLLPLVLATSGGGCCHAAAAVRLLLSVRGVGGTQPVLLLSVRGVGGTQPVLLLLLSVKTASWAAAAAAAAGIDNDVKVWAPTAGLGCPPAAAELEEVMAQNHHERRNAQDAMSGPGSWLLHMLAAQHRRCGAGVLPPPCRPPSHISPLH
jgi:hypothetical protein